MTLPVKHVVINKYRSILSYLSSCCWERSSDDFYAKTAPCHPLGHLSLETDQLVHLSLLDQSQNHCSSLPVMSTQQDSTKTSSTPPELPPRPGPPPSRPLPPVPKWTWYNKNIGEFWPQKVRLFVQKPRISDKLHQEVEREAVRAQGAMCRAILRSVRNCDGGESKESRATGNSFRWETRCCQVNGQEDGGGSHQRFLNQLAAQQHWPPKNNLLYMPAISASNEPFVELCYNPPP